MQKEFLDQQLQRLPDFWGLRRSQITHQLEYRVFSHPVVFSANDPRLLEAARISAARYSHSAASVEPDPITFSFILDDQMPAEPVPLDFPNRLRYLRVGSWLTIQGEPWLHAFANLDSRQGVAVVSSMLADQPVLLSRFAADTFTLNMLMRNGFGQIHASCVCRSGRAVLLSATHNTGKSTTAFRLALNGYRLLSDGMTFVRRDGPRLELLGYPVGEVKLRLDMTSAFPQVSGRGEAAIVREDQKMVYNLRALMPEKILEKSFWPEEVVVCLMERNGNQRTWAEPVDGQTALLALIPEASLYDDRMVVASNFAVIQTLLEKARCFRLSIGADQDGILQAIDGL